MSVPSVVALHDERATASDGKLVYAPDNPPHGVIRQWPDSVHPIFFFQFPLTGKYRVARYAPVDDLRSAFPWQQPPISYLLAVSRPMRPFRPHDRPPVAASNQHKAFSCGRRSQVCRNDLAVFNLIPQLQKLPLPFLKGLPGFFLHRFSFSYRPPGNELLHIFQDNHPRADSPGPSQHNPRKAPDIPVYQRRAFGFGEVLTIRREPRKPHRTAPANLSRVYIPHARLQVFRVWVVCPVH